jgi:predicted RNase H-related nuclease YkuK (DUF458 family)
MSLTIKLKQGTTAENQTFVGAVGELTADIEQNQLRLHDGITPGGTIIGPYDAPMPQGSTAFAPYITNYSTGETMPLQPAFTATAYIGQGTHVDSRWLIAEDAEFNTLVYDSDWTVDALTSLDTATISLTLVDSTEYHIAVTYRNNDGVESPRSTALALTALAPRPETPTIISPTHEGTVSSLTPILMASAYIGSVAHGESHWILATDAELNTIVHDTGWTSTHLESLDLETLAVELVDETVYYVAVSYRTTDGYESVQSPVVSFTAKVPVYVNGIEAGVFIGHSDSVRSVHYGLDGYVYSGGHDNTVRKIDPATMTVVEIFTGHTRQVHSVHYGSDGYVYSGGLDNTVRKIDPATMTEVGSFTGHTHYIYSVHVGTDGYVYSGGHDKTVRKIDPATMTGVGSFTGHTSAINSVHYGSDGYVYSGGYDNTVRKIDPATMTGVGSFTGHTSYIYSVHYGLDGYVYSGGHDNTVRKIDPATMTEVGSFTGHTGAINSVHYGSDGYVYSAAQDGTVRKIDPATMTEMGIFTGHTNTVYSVHVGTDGYVYSGGYDRRVRKTDFN